MPCNPSPCGQNSQCRSINGQAVCSCVSGYIGSPPSCRPECVVSSDCSRNEACSNLKCINPCVGTCGIQAQCQVINHNPICSCPAGFSGDPFLRCNPEIINVCKPSPCGPNALCQVINDSPSCTCLPGFINSPPNCRPECVSNSECLAHHACINQKCKDPCPGSCGENADCRVVSHTPMCVCSIGYTGDPFTQCVPFQECKRSLLAHHHPAVRMPFAKNKMEWDLALVCLNTLAIHTKDVDQSALLVQIVFRILPV